MKHFLDIESASDAELTRLFDLAIALRDERRAGKANRPVLAGKTLALVFEKPSLRTRVSFEQAMNELGGRGLTLTNEEVGLGKRESVADVGRVLSGMVHGIMARVFEHQKLIDLAKYTSVPVVNGLSDSTHPCQALADFLTVMDEFGRDLKGRTLAFIGDGNNVARSLASLSARLGVNFTLAAPKGYELDAPFLDGLRRAHPAVKVTLTADSFAAVKNADVVVTDTWVSMGQEAQAQEKRAAFANYQVNAKLMDAAPTHAIVLHCLPAYRGYEISADVIDGPRSRVFPEAHNRLHAQKALLAMLMGGQ